MKLVSISFLTFGLVACHNQNPYAGEHVPSADLSKMWKPSSVDVRALAVADDKGVSNNSFTVDLAPQVERRQIFIPFHFNSGNFRQMKVMRPKLQATGCSKQPQISPVEDPSTGKESTNFFYNSGPKLLLENRDLDYEQAKTIEADEEENIALVISADSTCTQLQIEFEVEFQ